MFSCVRTFFSGCYNCFVLDKKNWHYIKYSTPPWASINLSDRILFILRPLIRKVSTSPDDDSLCGA